MVEPEPLVTIAVPTYNRASTFLPHALGAARAQGYQNLEILVADNASTDATPDLVTGYADSRIRYLRHPRNLGSLANINSCIQSARGEYVLLLMDDDLIDPDFVATCVRASRDQPDAALVRTGTRVINGAGVLLYESPNQVGGLDFTEFVRAWVADKTAPFLCSTLFRTEPLREIGMTSRHGLWADVATELKLAARHGRVDVPDIKATFRQHLGAITAGVEIEKWCEDSQELLELVRHLAPDDAAELSQALIPFLALFNYRNALRLRRSWPERAAACVKVARYFGRPPSLAEVGRELVRQTPWLEQLRSARRTLQSFRS